MSRISSTLSSLLALNAAALGGCGSLAGTEYKGDPLATIQGSVRIETVGAPKNLVPALAFWIPSKKALELVDVDVTGKFPASFTMDVFEPPPAEAAMEMEDGAGEPNIAFAFITAATPDHPRYVPLMEQFSSSVVDGEGNETREEKTCNNEGDCFTSHYACVHGDFDDNGDLVTSCQFLSTSGTPMDPFTYFAGLSRNYILVYAFGEISTASEMSQDQNGGRPVSPGYHLLKNSGVAPVPTAEARACRDELSRQAWTEYNRQHGTTYETLDDVPGEEADDVEGAVTALVRAFEFQTPCRDDLGGKDLEIVDTWSKPLEILITPDISGFPHPD